MFGIEKETFAEADLDPPLESLLLKVAIPLVFEKVMQFGSLGS